MPLRRLIWLGCLLLGLAAASTASAYSCAAAITDVNFGSVTLRTGVTNRTTATVTVSCTGALPLVPIGVCVDIGAGSGGAGVGLDPRRLPRTSGSAVLDYQLRYSGFGAGSGVWTSQYMTVVPGIFGSGSATQTLYAEITSTGSTGSAGTYQSTFSGGTGATLTYGVLGCDLLGIRVSVPSFSVNATVASSCEVDSASLNFGQIPGALAGPIDASTSLTVRCSAGVPYAVRLTQGTGGPEGRTLKAGSAQLLYGLYQNAARSQPWGSLATNDVDSAGTGTSQSFSVYGRIFGGQTAPVGTYSDSVIVTVEY